MRYSFALLFFTLTFVLADHHSRLVVQRRGALCTFPTAKSTKSLSKPQVIPANSVFDCGLVRYDRGPGACHGQEELGDTAAVFLLENGATLRNCIIGPSQAEGVHCKGTCTLNNVWFEDVCEDAITLHGDATISGGGARNAQDKIVQHNGPGHVLIENYCALGAGKLYRSCGNCKQQFQRGVTIRNSIVQNAKVIAGINSNYGDTATIQDVKASGVKSICDTFEGTEDNSVEPRVIDVNKPNAACRF